jgi:hypothetical protein
MDALEVAEAALVEDQRFEHMKKRDIEDEVWSLACRSAKQPGQDHVAAFVEKYALEAQELTCFFPVEGLTLHREIDAFGVRLLPANAVDAPEFVGHPDFAVQMDSAVAVECSGTSNPAMMRRSREIAEHALRLLRVGLREHNMLIDRQLRFRLGRLHWFSDGSGGFRSTAEGGSIELTDERLEVAVSQPIASLPARGGTGVEQSANRALAWFEKAQLETDLLNELLFLFFALEAILGDRSEGLKAEGLALRRAILSHKQTGSFTHPGRVYSLYEGSRSSAVHGEKVPDVAEDEVRKFSEDVRLAINEFLGYASAHDFVKRGRVLRALDADPVSAEIKASFLPRTLDQGSQFRDLFLAAAHALRIDLERQARVGVAHFRHDHGRGLAQRVQQRVKRAAQAVQR